MRDKYRRRNNKRKSMNMKREIYHQRQRQIKRDNKIIRIDEKIKIKLQREIYRQRQRKNERKRDIIRFRTRRERLIRTRYIGRDRERLRDNYLDFN